MERREVTGWLLVAVQLVLIVGAIAAPGPIAFTPPPVASLILRVIGTISIAVAAWALLGLGRALSASPVPREEGALATTGLHAVVRHPTYALLILGVGAFAVSSGSWWRLGAWLALAVLLVAKGRWEDAMLAERFIDHAAYARRVPAWVPRRQR